MTAAVHTQAEFLELRDKCKALKDELDPSNPDYLAKKVEFDLMEQQIPDVLHEHKGRK